ncbi:MAG: DUF5700 domain-containing putative Zn-dependent protease [Candidatus Saliniplasma sp.]
MCPERQSCDMEIRIDGVSLLLDKLESVDEEGKLDENEIDEIVNHPDIQRWLKAYDWIEDREGKFERILSRLPEDIDHEKGEQTIQELWLQKIDYGLRKAMKNPEQMRSSVEEIKKYDWGSTVKKAKEYLPDETELEPVLVVTVDGFNGGMFRYGTVYLSLVYFDASLVSEDTFSHEIHHMGAEYWLEENARFQKYLNSDDKQKRYIGHLFTYLVGEGLANAFCSPGALTEVEGKEQHNKMVSYYQGNFDEIFDKLEGLVEKISGDPEEVSELYNDLTMDRENRGIPPGHFLSGKMVQTMDRSSNVSKDEIINLIKDPFDFFKIYNRAAEEVGYRKFSNDQLENTLEALFRTHKKEKKK